MVGIAVVARVRAMVVKVAAMEVVARERAEVEMAAVTVVEN